MNFTATRYHTTTADNGPAGRAVRYKEAAAATEGPALRHVGVQTVARATTLEPAPPSPASSTTSLHDSSSTEPTNVGVRNTPVRDASAAANAPAARPASTPTEDLKATYSRRAAPVDLRSSPVPALYRLRKAPMPAAASGEAREPSPAPPARRRSRVTAPHVQRISAPAHAKHEAKRQAKRDAGMDSEDESDGGDAICDYERREADDRERRNVVDDAAARLACARDRADATGVAGSAASAATGAQNDPRRTGVQTVAIPTAALAAAATPASASAPSPTPSLREGASPGPTAAISCSPRLTPAAGRKMAGRATRRPASPSLATPVIVDSFFPPQVSPANKRFRAKIIDTRDEVSYLVAQVLGSQGARSDWREREEMLQMQ